MRSLLILSIAVVVPSMPSSARADRGEWRLSLAGDVPGFIDMQESGGKASGSAVWGTRVRVAFGTSDRLEIGGDLGFVSASAVHFSDATVEGLRGDLYGDLYAFEIAPSVRLIAPALLHTSMAGLIRPILDIRGGLLMRALASQEGILFKDGMPRLIGRPDAAISALPFVGATGGIEWRFADVYAIGLAGDLVYAGDGFTGVGIAVELSWLTFAKP